MHRTSGAGWRMVHCDLLLRSGTTNIVPAYPSLPLLVQVDFEVFGDVHGVYFTKYAKDMSSFLGVRGWIRLSRWGTAMGQIQGDKDKVDEMAMWLRLQGSPGARIERCEFRNWQIIDSFSFRNFNVRF